MRHVARLLGTLVLLGIIAFGILALGAVPAKAAPGAPDLVISSIRGCRNVEIIIMPDPIPLPWPPIIWPPIIRPIQPRPRPGDPIIPIPRPPDWWKKIRIINPGDGFKTLGGGDLGLLKAPPGPIIPPIPGPKPLPLPKPSPGDKVPFYSIIAEITVKNIGDAPSGPTHLKGRFGGKSWVYLVGGLGPGEEATFYSEIYLGFVKPQSIVSITATVDPYGRVEEISEDNNSAKYLLK